MRQPKRRHAPKRKVSEASLAALRRINAARAAAREGRPDSRLGRWKARGIDMTAERYDELLAAQGGVCAICRKPPTGRRLAVDHCHRTRRVRGILCYRCNRYFIGRHTVETAKRVLDYLVDAERPRAA